MSETISGISIPFRFDPATGGVARARGTEKLKENIIHILLTRVGERVMRRRYGGGLQQLVQDPNDQVLRTLLQHQIARSLGEHEPRILLERIEIRQQDAMLVVELGYLIRQTREREILSVPIDQNWL